MPIFQVKLRTPSTPPPPGAAAAEAAEQNCAKHETTTTTPPQHHVRQAVAAVESSGSCSPSRSFLEDPPEPSTPTGPIVLSPCMRPASSFSLTTNGLQGNNDHRITAGEQHDDGQSISDEQLLEFCAAIGPLVDAPAAAPTTYTTDVDHGGMLEPSNGRGSLEDFVCLQKQQQQQHHQLARRRDVMPFESLARAIGVHESRDGTTQTDPIPASEELKRVQHHSKEKRIAISSHVAVGWYIKEQQGPAQDSADVMQSESMHRHVQEASHVMGVSLASKSPRTDQEAETVSSEELVKEQDMESTELDVKMPARPVKLPATNYWDSGTKAGERNIQRGPPQVADRVEDTHGAVASRHVDKLRPRSTRGPVPADVRDAIECRQKAVPGFETSSGEEPGASPGDELVRAQRSTFSDEVPEGQRWRTKRPPRYTYEMSSKSTDSVDTMKAGSLAKKRPSVVPQGSTKEEISQKRLFVEASKPESSARANSRTAGRDCEVHWRIPEHLKRDKEADGDRAMPQSAAGKQSGSFVEAHVEEDGREFYIFTVPESVKPGERFPIAWPGTSDGENLVFPVLCPISYPESSTSSKPRYVKVLAPGAESQPCSTHTCSQSEQNCQTQPEYSHPRPLLSPPRRKSTRGTSLGTPGKEWIHYRRGSSRVGRKFQATDIPAIGEHQETMYDTTKKDNSGVIWDPNLARQAEDRGEDLADFLTNEKACDASDLMEILHKSEYCVGKAKETPAFKRAADDVEVPFTRFDSRVFSKLIVKHNKDFAKVAADMLKFRGSCMVHYYNRFKKSPAYSAWRKRSADEHSKLCYICTSGGDLLICTQCKRWYHMDCLTSRKSVPSGQLRCNSCAEQQRHQSDSEGQKADVETCQKTSRVGCTDQQERHRGETEGPKADVETCQKTTRVGCADRQRNHGVSEGLKADVETCQKTTRVGSKVECLEIAPSPQGRIG